MDDKWYFDDNSYEEELKLMLDFMGLRINQLDEYFNLFDFLIAARIKSERRKITQQQLRPSAYLASSAVRQFINRDRKLFKK